MSECCKVRYSTTLAGVHVYNFSCSENKGFVLMRDLCLGGSSCMVKITPNAPNLDHAKKCFFRGSVF